MLSCPHKDPLSVDTISNEGHEEWVKVKRELCKFHPSNLLINKKGEKEYRM